MSELVIAHSSSRSAEVIGGDRMGLKPGRLGGMRVAPRQGMTIDLPVLQCGKCEPLKLGVHAGALGIAVLCGVYNAAAWLKRRDTHLAVNTILYAALSIWEHQHVLHHIAAMKPVEPRAAAGMPEPHEPPMAVAA